MQLKIQTKFSTKICRSSRTVEALTDYVKNLLESTITEFPNAAVLMEKLDKSKRNVIANFKCRDCPEYQNFQKAAGILRDDCVFWVSDGVENTITFRDPGTEDEQKVFFFVSKFFYFLYLFSLRAHSPTTIL